MELGRVTGIEGFYFEDLSMRDLEASMHLSGSGVKMILFRGRQELRRMMKK